jgi:hypothetical protein
MHTHGEMVHDMLFFQGTAEQVFDDLDGVRGAYRQVEYRPIAPVLRSVRARQLRGGGAALACSYMSAATREWARVGDAWRVFYRKARCQLDPGVRDWVIVLLHRARAPELPPTYRLHAGVRVYYAEANGTATLARDPGVPLWALGREITYRGLLRNRERDTEMGDAFREAYRPIIDASAASSSTGCNCFNDGGEQIQI